MYANYMKNNNKIDQLMEQLCNKGCRSVSRIIDAMEQGGLPEEAENLDTKERQALLLELKTIMKTYE